MNRSLAAYTPAESPYPPYFNVTLDGDEVLIVVRAAADVRPNGAYICGYACDAGQPGRCTPGDDRCNNYCNMASEKGPMQDRPAPCTQVYCGQSASMRMPLNAFIGVFNSIRLNLSESGAV